MEELKLYIDLVFILKFVTCFLTLFFFAFSECLTEKDISYYGNDVNNGLDNVQPDVESCRASCKSMGSPYFDFNYGGNRGCYCKTSNAGRRQVNGVISGKTCIKSERKPSGQCPELDCSLCPPVSTSLLSRLGF